MNLKIFFHFFERITFLGAFNGWLWYWGFDFILNESSSGGGWLLFWLELIIKFLIGLDYCQVLLLLIELDEELLLLLNWFVFWLFNDDWWLLLFELNFWGWFEGFRLIFEMEFYGNIA